MSSLCAMEGRKHGRGGGGVGGAGGCGARARQPECSTNPEFVYRHDAAKRSIVIVIVIAAGMRDISRGTGVSRLMLVSLGLHCFLPCSSAALIVVLVPGCCWAYSAFSV